MSISLPRCFFWILLFGFGLLASPATAQKQLADATSTPASSTTRFAPNVKPALHIPKREGPIEIDGVLDEAAWQQAAHARNFSETFPDDQMKPPIDVSVYVTYDDHHFYVAYQIKDDPNAIRANLSDRDQIWNDDYSGILLDTNGDGQEVYFIAANPIGIQGDTRISRGNEDLSFNLVYESEGQLTEDGYQIEMAIPFRSLRFPQRDVQEWEATFWITHPRDSRNTYSWAAMDRDNPCMSCQFGALNGMRGVESGKNLEILPSITGAQSGALRDFDNPNSAFDNNRINVDPSLDLKYGISSDLTADLTINPDYSQIEADAAQVDVNTTFALSFPERRPFFQEGSDLFRTPIDIVYTRSINNPIAAGKLTGRFGSTNVAYIGARDNTSPLLLPFEESSALVSVGKSISNLVRVQHNFPDNSYIGALATDRRLEDGGAGSTLGVDGTFRFLTNYQLEGHFVASRTEEPDAPALSDGLDYTFDDGNHTAALDGETFGGHALYASFERDARHWNFDFDYWETSPTFRADNGFVTQNNYRAFIAYQGYTFYTDNISFINRIRPFVSARREWNFDAVRKDESINTGVSFSMIRQTQFWTEYTLRRERFQDIDFDDLREWEIGLESQLSEKIGLGTELELGRDIARNLDAPETGNSLEFSAWGTLRPTQRLKLQPSFTYAELSDRGSNDNFFRGYIARIRTDYQFTRRFFLRTVVQYNDFAERLDVDPLFTYRINPFTVFHVGSTHTFDSYPGQLRGEDRFLQQTQRQFFFKFQYLIRT
ncbi:MAG TPA: DUF5916 domain-containing protein [Rhodothermales bacterium]|nr:DUF5916 domain-containing protein [Rhodothermales bacterium]